MPRMILGSAKNTCMVTGTVEGRLGNMRHAFFVLSNCHLEFVMLGDALVPKIWIQKHLAS